MSSAKRIANTAPSALEILWEQNFFKEGKQISEIEYELHKIGYNFTKQNLSMALKNSKFLMKIGNPSLYKYLQKYPFMRK